MSTEPPPSSTSTKALIGVLLAGTVGVIIFLFVHLSGGKSPKLGTPTAAANCGGGTDCLPDVKYVDTQGIAYTPQSLAGKVVVVNFWATWCKPCLKEIPDLSKISEKYAARGVQFLGILTNDPVDNSTLLNFQSDHEMTFPSIRATSDILSAYDYPGNLPTTFVFDRNGRRAHNQVGAMSSSQLASVLEPLVDAQQTRGVSGGGGCCSTTGDRDSGGALLLAGLVLGGLSRRRRARPAPQST